MWPTWLTRDAGLLLVARAFMSAARALAGVVVPIYLAIQGFSALLQGIITLLFYIFFHSLPPPEEQKPD